MLSKYFGDRGFWRVTLRLAVPIALQNLLTSSYSLVDTLLVGQLGDVVLSAVGMAGQWSWFLNIVLFGICSGAQLFVSQYWGVRDETGIRRAYGIALLSSMIVAAVFTVSAAAAPGFVIGLFNDDPAVKAAGCEYISIACWSYPALALSLVLSTVLRATENVRLPMAASGFTTVLNAFLDYALIFGAFGFPEMGVAGAALATVISAWCAPVIVLAVAAVKKLVVVTKPREMFGFGASHLREFFRRAAPVMLNESMWGAGTLTLNLILSNLSYEVYAAVTITRTFENFAFVFFIGLCNACAIMVGMSVGAGKISRAVGDVRRFLTMFPIISLICGMLMILFRAPLVSIFNTEGNITEATSSAAQLILIIYGAHFAVRNIPYILIVGTFRPSGDTMTGTKFEMICLWLCAIPATYAAAYLFELPLAAVIITMYVSEDLPKSILCLMHYRREKWIRPVTEEGIAGLERYLEGSSS